MLGMSLCLGAVVAFGRRFAPLADALAKPEDAVEVAEAVGTALTAATVGSGSRVAALVGEVEAGVEGPPAARLVSSLLADAEAPRSISAPPAMPRTARIAAAAPTKMRGLRPRGSGASMFISVRAGDPSETTLEKR